MSAPLSTPTATACAESVYYNGWRAGADVPDPVAEPGRPSEESGLVAARALGIENMAARCVQGRGVMIDLHAMFGRARQLIGYDDADARAARRAAPSSSRATWSACTPASPARSWRSIACRIPRRSSIPTPRSTARDARLLRWIDDSGIAVLIADNFAVEAVPAVPTRLRDGRAAARALHLQARASISASFGTCRS